jgi:hypothetical protein
MARLRLSEDQCVKALNFLCSERAKLFKTCEGLGYLALHARLEEVRKLSKKIKAINGRLKDLKGIK